MTKAQKRKIILTIICISFIQGLQYCVSPVLGQIQEHYPQISVNLIQMLITAPGILSILVAITSGFLVTKISKKKLLLLASMIAGITGFLPFLADNFWLLFVSRIIFGVALGLATTLNTAVVAEFFHGDERVSVMGIQGASVGAGMVTVMMVSGLLGQHGFTNAYFINVIGLIALVVIAWCLPETGVVKVTNTEKIHLNSQVFKVATFGFLEFFFLITFTTNISMHLSGVLAGNSAVSGYLTGIFSGIQILAGFLLGAVTKVTKKYTLPAAMFCFSIGGALLVAFPSNFTLLAIGAVFCGLSQGIFIPTGMVAVSNAVRPVATAMAAACFTCATCLGQLLSPTILNTTSRLLLGSVTPGNVYLIATIGMTVSGLAACWWKKNDKNGGYQS